jgi:hypothetical protein
MYKLNNNQIKAVKHLIFAPVTMRQIISDCWSFLDKFVGIWGIVLAYYDIYNNIETSRMFPRPRILPYMENRWQLIHIDFQGWNPLPHFCQIRWWSYVNLCYRFLATHVNIISLRKLSTSWIKRKNNFIIMFVISFEICPVIAILSLLLWFLPFICVYVFVLFMYLLFASYLIYNCPSDFCVSTCIKNLTELTLWTRMLVLSLLTTCKILSNLFGSGFRFVRWFGCSLVLFLFQKIRAYFKTIQRCTL